MTTIDTRPYTHDSLTVTAKYGNMQIVHNYLVDGQPAIHTVFLFPHDALALASRLMRVAAEASEPQNTPKRRSR